MSNLQAILRAECARGTDVPQVPTQANRQLMESLGGNSKFVTFFYGALDPRARRLSYSNAGHNPPLVVRAGGTIEELATGGLILGVFPMAEYEQGTVDLAAGDLVVLFTDGVTEAESRHGLYSDERLQELVLRERGRSAREIAQTDPRRRRPLQPRPPPDRRRDRGRGEGGVGRARGVRLEKPAPGRCDKRKPPRPVKAAGVRCDCATRSCRSP